MFLEPVSTNYQWCQGGSFFGTFVGLRDYGFTRAGNGHLYAALHTQPDTIRVFESDDKGHDWREFCPANIGNQFDGGPGGGVAIDSGAATQTTPWLQASYTCPNLVIDGGIAANGSMAATNEVMWPTLAADGDNWILTSDAGLFFNGPANIANQKSRLLLTYAQTTKAGTGPQYPPYTQVFQANTDPASPGFGTDNFQRQTQLGIMGLVGGPQPGGPPPQGPNISGQYSGIATQYATVPCVEDAGWDATPPYSFNPTIQCTASIFWPYWVDWPDGGSTIPTNVPTVITGSVVVTN